MLQQHNLKLIVYADSEQEAQELQKALNDFIVTKHKQGIYPRAARLSKLINQYGNSAMVNAYLN